jgi:hypothetical protein
MRLSSLISSLGHQSFPTVTTLLDPKLLHSEFGKFLRIALASLMNLDNLLCDKLRPALSVFYKNPPTGKSSSWDGRS